MRCEMHKLRIINVQDLLDLTTPFHDICILARVGIASAYMYLVDFPCILNISQIGNERAHNNVLYQDSTWNLFHNTIGIVKSEKIQVSSSIIKINII